MDIPGSYDFYSRSNYYGFESIDMKNIRVIRYALAVLILTFAFIVIFPEGVLAETVIYDSITSSQYKSIVIDDLTNINYLDSYTYKVYLNDTYLGEYKKGEQILVPDDSKIKIVVPAGVKQSISSNNFVSIITVGFYSFMQYGIYIILIIFILYWLLNRKRR